MSDRHNFKLQQQLAKATSTRLVFFYALTLGLTILFYALASYCLIYILEQHKYIQTFLSNDIKTHLSSFNWYTNTIISVSVICLILILFSSIRNYRQTKKMGGMGVAQMLGGNSVGLAETANERKLLNVVEEMAIASGIELPHIFISEDMSINAFVSGFKGDYCITVSRGALEFLTREELQAVVAHEFGHILSQDTDLNMKLISILAGFALIATATSQASWLHRLTLRNVFPSKRRNSGSIVLFIILFILAIYCITRISIFFGRLLQAAISRQREYLSDAYSVNFTRNPQALIMALKKAYAQQLDPQTKTTKVSQNYAHLLFFNYQNTWFSSHPSIKQRIKKYGGTYSKEELTNLQAQMNASNLHEDEQAFEFSSPE